MSQNLLVYEVERGGGKIYVFNFDEGAEPPGAQGWVSLKSYFNPTPKTLILKSAHPRTCRNILKHGGVTTRVLNRESVLCS